MNICEFLFIFANRNIKRRESKQKLWTTISSNNQRYRKITLIHNCKTTRVILSSELLWQVWIIQFGHCFPMCLLCSYIQNTTYKMAKIGKNFTSKICQPIMHNNSRFSNNRVCFYAWHSHTCRKIRNQLEMRWWQHF